MNRRLGSCLMALAMTLGGPAVAAAVTDEPRRDPQTCIQIIVESLTFPDDEDCEGESGG